MIALRLTVLLVGVALIYAMFVQSQTRVAPLPPELVQSGPGASPAPPSRHARDPYKEAMDRAQAAAKAMQAQHADADSF